MRSPAACSLERAKIGAAFLRSIVQETLTIVDLATLDRRHFHAVRARHMGGFQLLP